MTSVEVHAKSPGQENGEGAVPVNSKKNPSRQQNGKQKSNRQRENRGPAKDGAQRVYPEPQNVIDEEDESDLAPPDPVPEPSAEENNTLLSAIRAEINDLEQKVAAINSEISKAKDVRDIQDAGVKDLRAELNALRAQTAQIRQQKDDLTERFDKLRETIRTQDSNAVKIQKDLKFRSEEETDAAIKQLSHRLETSSLDLKTEKEILKELKKLNGDKERIREWTAQVNEIKAKRFAHEDLFLQRQAKGAELKALRDQEKALLARMDAIRSGEGMPDGYNASTRITALLDEKARLVEAVQNKRGDLQSANVAFKLRLAEYRDYKKAQQAYEWKLERREMRKRRAEAAARADKIKEERRQREAERKEAKRQEERRMLAVAEGCQLYVGGLAIRCDDEALRAHFARFGTVSDVSVIRDKETGLSRGFGFVTLTDVDKAKEAAKQCNGREAKGLCPQHGRMQVRLASKSKAQQEFEARRAKTLARSAQKSGGGATGAGEAADGANGDVKAEVTSSEEEEEEEEEAADVEPEDASGAAAVAGTNGLHSASAAAAAAAEGATEEED